MDAVPNNLPEKKKNLFARLSLVFLIIGIFPGMGLLLLTGLIPGILLEISIALGVISLIKIKINPDIKGKTLSITTITLASILLALILFMSLATGGHGRGRYSNPAFSEPEPLLASQSEPITLSRQSISAYSGEPVFIKANVYNTLSYEKDFLMSVECNPPTLIRNQVSSHQIISPSEQSTLIMQMTLSRESGTYICKVYAVNISNTDTETAYTYSKEIILEIR
jgi:hypothetical protein